MRFDDLLLDPAPTVVAAARRDWRWYVPIWIFPVVFFYVPLGTRTTEEGRPDMLVWVALWAYQFIAFALAVSLAFLQRATIKQTWVLGILVPLGIAGVTAFTQPAVLAAIGWLQRR